MAISYATVDEYIASFPEDVAARLSQVREIIRRAAPDSVEAMSYQIPTAKLHGRYAVYFAGWKKHIAIYPFREQDDPAIEAVASPYRDAKATLQFVHSKPLPLDVIELVVARMLADAEKQAAN